MAECRNCGGGYVYARSRCRHCYRYFMRHGTERPLDFQRRLVERQIEKDHIRRSVAVNYKVVFRTTSV